MKSMKKPLILAVCAVVLVAASVLGTLAYLTSTAKVTNTFTVGNVKITLDEAKVTPDGIPVVPEERVESNEYHLIPGETYTKDPTVTVLKGSEESYVRMLVTINEFSDLQAIFGADFLPQDYVTGWDESVWNCVKVGNVVNDTVTYEFRYYTTVDASEATEDVVLEALFQTISMPGEVTGEELETIAGLQIDVVGHAIQTSSFANADEAWAAFDAQMGK